jgi:hypothetical protein
MAKKKAAEVEPITTEVATIETPPMDVAVVDDMAADAGMGFENMGAQDMAIPFILILQGLSPQVKRGPTQIEGAKEGDFFNSVTGAVYDGTEGIFFIPSYYRKAWVEWTPRDAGGGFVKQHDSDAILSGTTKNEKGQDVLPNGHLVVTTAYHYGLVVEPMSGKAERAVLSFTSTQLKKSRKWNSIMMNIQMQTPDKRNFTPPMFSQIYKLTTEVETNPSGSWSGWKIELFGAVPNKELYSLGKKFALDLKAGMVKEAAPPSSAPDESDVPF